MWGCLRHGSAGLRRAVAVLALMVLSGCGVLIPVQTAPFVPASRSLADGVLARYESKLRAVLAGYEADRLRHFAGLTNRSRGPVPDWILPEVAAAEALAASMAQRILAPLPPVTPGPRSYDGRWRRAEAHLLLSPDARVWNRPFLFSGINAVESRVIFHALDGRDARITARCAGPVTLTLGDGSLRQYAEGSFGFTLPGRSRNQLYLTLGPKTDRCDLRVRFDGKPVQNLVLQRQEATRPDLTMLDRRYDVCAVPRPARTDALEAAFFASRWLSQTCAMDPGTITLLPNARDGYNAKVQALTGGRLPAAVFDAGDPTAAIDFSRAPQLDMIMLSYLDLKADFSGFIMVRMLRFHAQRGTRIRILVSDILERGKDRALYEGLARDFANVQVQFYDWNPPAFAPPDEVMAAIHRVHHIKMFATLSPQPGQSRAILGGRNIHDGFLFESALDLSQYPWLQNYGQPGELSLNYFATYHDFEIELRDPAVVTTLLAHLSTFWNRDAATTVYRPFSVSVAEARAGTVPLTGARHFMSVPFLDGGALEDFWVELIDSAQTSVEIVTPYLNPTPRIETALDRAVARKIKVMIVARIRLDGDLGGRLMTEMNMLFVERNAARMIIWEYDPPDVVLHSKMLMIDGRLSIITSTNLNRRSFRHDTENGLVVLNPVFYRRLRAEVQGYIAQSRRLRPTDTDVRPLARKLFANAFVRDLF